MMSARDKSPTERPMVHKILYANCLMGRKEYGTEILEGSGILTMVQYEDLNGNITTFFYVIIFIQKKKRFGVDH